MICEAAIGESVVLREAAFECLVKVAGLYYDTLPAYMEAIFTLTQRAVSADEEDVAKQAIEFWCSICEEEMDLIEVWAQGLGLGLGFRAPGFRVQFEGSGPQGLGFGFRVQGPRNALHSWRTAERHPAGLRLKSERLGDCRRLETHLHQGNKVKVLNRATKP